MVFLNARVGGLRCERREAGEHRCAGAINVGPRAQSIGVAILLRRGEPGRVHGRELRAIAGERLARSTEIEQDRTAVGTQINVGGLDIEMQKLVRMHFAKAVQQVHEHMANETLGHLVLPHLDLLLQRAAALVAHHHVHGFVGAKEVEHAHDIRMIDLRERAAFLEKALHAVAERRQVLNGCCPDDVALGA